MKEVGQGLSNESRVVMEFHKVNIFVSVDALREWFEQLIRENKMFTKMPMQNIMQFDRGPYFFVDNRMKKQHLSEPFAVTVSFCDLQQSVETLVNPKICNMKVNIV